MEDKDLARALATVEVDTSLNSQMKIKINEISAQAKNFTVVDKESYDNAAAKINTLNSFSKKIKEFYKVPKEKAANAWKAALDAKQAVSEQEKNWLNPINESKEHLKREQGAYTQRLLRIQQEKEREAQRKAYEETKKREEEAKFLAEKEAKARGLSAEEVKPVEVVIAKPEPVAAIEIPTKSITTLYEISNIDISKLPAVYAGEELVSPKVAVIKRLIKEYNSTHSSLLKIPGVEYKVIAKAR